MIFRNTSRRNQSFRRRQEEEIKTMRGEIDKLMKQTE
jgi:hypothetical protein